MAATGLKPHVSHVVITVHGIRTYGEWQERLEQKAHKSRTGSDGSIAFYHFHYGFFSVLAFFFPFTRYIRARLFRRQLENLFEDTKSVERIDIFAHSFGTYVVAKALGMKPFARDLPVVDNVVFAGSVLPSDFDWTVLVPKKIKRVINEVGTRDNIIFLNRLAIPFLGAAGLLGFRTFEGSNFVQRYFRVGHSGYFEKRAGDADWFLSKYWCQIINSPPASQLHRSDERDKLTSARGVMLFILNNATIVKASFLISVVGAIAFWILGLYANAEAQRQLAVARLAARETVRLVQENHAGGSLSPDIRLLAVEALGRLPEPEADQFLRTNVMRLAPDFGARRPITSLALTADGRFAAIAYSQVVEVSKLDRPKPRWNAIDLAFGEKLNALRFNDNGKVLAARTGDRLYVMTLSEGDNANKIEIPYAEFALSAAGKSVAVIKSSTELIVFDVTKGTSSSIPLPDGSSDTVDDQELPTPLPPVLPDDTQTRWKSQQSVVFVDEDTVAVVRNTKELLTIDLGSEQVSSTPTRGEANAIFVSSDGKIVAIAQESPEGSDPASSMLQLFQIAAGAKPRLVWSSEGPARAPVFISGGQDMLFLGSDASVSRLDLATNEVASVCFLDEVQDGAPTDIGPIEDPTPPPAFEIVPNADGANGLILTDSYHEIMRVIAFNASGCRPVGHFQTAPTFAAFLDQTTAIVRSSDETLTAIDASQGKILSQNAADKAKQMAFSALSKVMLFSHGSVVRWVRVLCVPLIRAGRNFARPMGQRLWQ